MPTSDDQLRIGDVDLLLPSAINRCPIGKKFNIANLNDRVWVGSRLCSDRDPDGGFAPFAKNS